MAGERVRIYQVSLGNEIDLHHLGISGHSFTFRHQRVSGVQLVPGTMYAADTIAVGGGGWLLQSSVIHHAERGMVSRLTVPLVGSSSTTPSASGSTREYFIAGEETIWDYIPQGTDACFSDAFKKSAEDLFPLLDNSERYGRDGTDVQGFSDSVRAFIASGDTSIGRFYRKARYVGYTDSNFNRLSANVNGSSTGILGPVLRAVSGDVIKIIFRNSLSFDSNLAFPSAPLLLVSLRSRPIGASTWTSVPGMPAELAAWPVPTGYEAEFYWRVPQTAGPAPADSATIAWTYGSSVSVDHLFAGLVGGLIVAKSNAALYPGSFEHGADREYVLAFFISNENRSPFLDDNFAQRTGDPSSVDKADADFEESNLMHAVSGLLACNLRLNATVGDTVRFHLLGLGAELDLHTPQFHGHMQRSGVDEWLTRSTALGIHPGSMATVEIVTKAAGQWLVECGVNDHWAAGMRASLVVHH